MDKTLAALGLLICAALALRMVLGPQRCQRFDDACIRRYRGLVAQVSAWRSRKPAPKPVDAKAARQEAESLIERARRPRPEMDQEGNVIRPRAFDPSKKKPPLH